MQIPPTFEQQKKPSDKGYLQYLATVLSRMWTQLANVVNYGIQLYALKSDGTVIPANIKGFIWFGFLVVGNNTFTHNLGYTPRLVIPTTYVAPAVIYVVTTNPVNITVNSNAAVQATLLIT